jgi:uncharacterized membrane protein YkoI
MFKASGVSQTGMRPLLTFIVLGLAMPAVPVAADPSPEQGQVREQQRAGHVRSLRQIEKRILPKMEGKQYLGPEYDPAAMAYRLKFLDNGKVYFVDVDARTGQIIARSQ